MPRKLLGVPSKTTDINNRTCPTCGRVVSRSNDLARHMLLHDKNKEREMHRCAYEGCGYKNIQRSNVTTHMRTHTRERPLKCPDCKFDTADPGSLTRHKKTLHRYDPKGNSKTKEKKETYKFVVSGKVPRERHTPRKQPYPSRSVSPSIQQTKPDPGILELAPLPSPDRASPTQSLYSEEGVSSSCSTSSRPSPGLSSGSPISVDDPDLPSKYSYSAPGPSYAAYSAPGPSNAQSYSQLSAAPDTQSFYPSSLSRSTQSPSNAQFRFQPIPIVQGHVQSSSSNNQSQGQPNAQFRFQPTPFTAPLRSPPSGPQQDTEQCVFRRYPNYVRPQFQSQSQSPSPSFDSDSDQSQPGPSTSTAMRVGVDFHYTWHPSLRSPLPRPSPCKRMKRGPGPETLLPAPNPPEVAHVVPRSPRPQWPAEGTGRHFNSDWVWDASYGMYVPPKDLDPILEPSANFIPPESIFGVSAPLDDGNSEPSLNFTTSPPPTPSLSGSLSSSFDDFLSMLDFSSSPTPSSPTNTTYTEFLDIVENTKSYPSVAPQDAENSLSLSLTQENLIFEWLLMDQMQMMTGGETGENLESRNPPLQPVEEVLMQSEHPEMAVEPDYEALMPDYDPALDFDLSTPDFDYFFPSSA